MIVSLVTLASCVPKKNEVKKSRAERPNILLILADDLGINDLGVYGNRNVLTPNIDYLSETGFRFTRFYTAGDICQPTRASLLTGLYPQRLGFSYAPRGISEEVITLPELLRDAGYATHHVGKWHLGHSPKEVLPLSQGYDTFFGFLNQLLLRPKSGIVRPLETYHNPYLVTNNEAPVQYSGHLTDLLTDYTVQLIHENRDTQPWFINQWYYAPHGPIEPPTRWIDHYPKSSQGKYYALVSTLDEGVGRILNALKDSHQIENTIIIFLSDNGATEQFAPSNYPYFGTKTQFYEGGVRVPLIVRLPRDRDGVVVDTVVSSIDLFPTIAALAGVEVKHHVDGSILTPPFNKSPRVNNGEPLFWEFVEFSGPWADGVKPDPFLSSPEHLAPDIDFSVLSADGRWRLTKERKGIALFDLVADPTGYTNVLSDNPEIADELIEMYRAWAWKTLRVPLQAIVRGEAKWDGEAVYVSGGLDRVDFVGNNMLRTPGLSADSQGISAWSFGIGIQFERLPKIHQVIAHQEGVWSLTLNREGKLTFKMADETLSTRVPAIGNCTALVLITFQFRSDVYPIGTLLGLKEPRHRFRYAMFEIYVNGTKAGKKEIRSYIPDSALREATLLGNGSELNNGFIGTLRHPTVFSARLSPEQIAELSKDVCKH